MVRRLLRTAAVTAALVLGSGIGVPVQQAQAVIGGQPAPIASAPWESIIIIGGSSLCGGSFVSPMTIVTAAHCFNGTRDIAQVRAYAGVQGIQDTANAKPVPLAGLTIHPGYDSATYANDIAILTLSAPASAPAIALPTGQDPAAWPSAGTSARIAGWGVTTPGSTTTAGTLNAATVQVLAAPGAPCGEYGTSQPANVICAGVPNGGIDTCQGDSGSPLVVDLAGVPTLAGVTSAGQACADAAFPGIYTSVAAFLPWLTPLITQAPAGSTAQSPGTPAAKAGTTLSAARLKALAGFAPTRLSGATKGTCAVKGTSLRLLKAGTCSVTATGKGRKVTLRIAVA